MMIFPVVVLIISIAEKNWKIEYHLFDLKTVLRKRIKMCVQSEFYNQIILLSIILLCIYVLIALPFRIWRIWTSVFVILSIRIVLVAVVGVLFGLLVISVIIIVLPRFAACNKLLNISLDGIIKMLKMQSVCYL
jgi:hypothetical protein